MIEKIWKLTEKGITDYNGKVGSLEEVVEVLNTYHFTVNDYLRENNKLREENEELKKENYKLHKRLGDFEPFEKYIKERTSKITENEELKQEIQGLKEGRRFEEVEE